MVVELAAAPAGVDEVELRGGVLTVIYAGLVFVLLGFAAGVVFAGVAHFAGAGELLPLPVSVGLAGVDAGFEGVHFDVVEFTGRGRLLDDVFAAAYCGAVHVFACGGMIVRGEFDEGSGEVEEGR